MVTISDQVALHPDMQYWDVLEPNVLRYNRWRCDHGWDVDLDDGSSFLSDLLQPASQRWFENA